MRQLSIDIETYSSTDIKLGVYRYVDAPDFQILLFAYAFDDGPVELVDLACGEALPANVVQALTDKTVLKKAYNAQFERVCIGKHLGTQLDVRQWWCTMAHAAQLGLPGRLGDVAALLKLEQQKDKAGTLLINYFSKPCKPTKANGERKRNYPYHDMDKWDLFCKYCKQDVETERAIGKYLEQFPPLANELLIYREDQRINDRGIQIDMDLVDAVLEYNDLHAADLLDQSAEITGLANANSRDQLLSWIQGQGVDIPDIRKETLEALLDTEIPDPVRIVINNRLETGKASIKKYQSIKNSICADGRVHGTLRYYGASRTGRWSGQILQPQNLSKNLLPEIDAVRTLVKRKDFDTLEMLYPSMSELFKQLIRTTIIAGEGNTLAIADYSAIEARVIAWLAGEQWAMDVFAHDGDIYKMTASQMFRIPIDQIDKPLRQRGKVSVLALGYQGGTGALIAMGALKMGVPEEDLPKLVKAWRKANPHIVKLWRDVEECAKRCITDRSTVKLHHGVSFKHDKGYLFVQLPSGRQLAYFNPNVTADGKIKYAGIESGKRVWGSNESYGGKLVENIVQAIARDCLAEALLKVAAAGYQIITHIHDELVVEVSKQDADQHLAVIRKLMGSQLAWAPDLYLTAAGYTSDYYLKD